MKTPMEIKINRHSLSDAPYHKENEGVCIFDQSQIENFVCELEYGSQTCYLVSGYRGSGKTSFINKVRQIIEDKNNNPGRPKFSFATDKNTPEAYQPVFVYSSFAKYNNQTAFLRQIIRNLFLAFEDTKKSNGEPILCQLSDETRTEFTTLNHRTFFDVKTQYEISTETTFKEAVGISTKLDKLIKGIFKAIIPVPVLLFGERLFTHFDFPLWASLLLGVAFISWFIFSLVKISATKTNTNTSRGAVNANELYDDEIAAYHFEKILKKLKREGYKIIFILDELDKVNEKEINSLINEMKPHLLSGLADFIVVAGQQLTYKYVSASEDDDEVVKSLFSKVFHVPLKHPSELRIMVKDKIFDAVDFDSSQREQLDNIIEKYIFQSRRIPRILINQIRQAMVWKGNCPYLMSADSTENAKYKQVIETIEAIVKDTIEPRGYKEVVRDYLIVQLYGTASILDAHNGRRIRETDILGKFQKTTFSHHPLYFNELAPCLNKLIVRLEEILKFQIIRDEKTSGDITTSDFNTSENSKPQGDPEGDATSTDISKIALSETLEAFKDEINECSWVLRTTYLAISRENRDAIHNYTTYELIVKFLNEGFLKINLPKDPQFRSFLTSPSILDNSEALHLAYQITTDAKIDFNTIALDVLHEFLRRSLNQVFSDYTLFQDPNDDLSDYRLESKITDFPNLLLDFKFLKSGIDNLKAPEISRRLIRYNVSQGKGNFAALVVFTSEARDSYAAERFKLMAESRTIGKNADGASINFGDELSFIILSIQNMNKIYDELTYLKNAMCTYEIDSSGLPTWSDIPIRRNRAFQFRNQYPLSTDPGRNDHQLPEISKAPSELVVKIKPEKSSCWRYGLKFSSSGVFPKFEEGRHVSGYPDIHISVGEPEKGKDNAPMIKGGKYVWGRPNLLTITNYYISPQEGSDWSFSQYNGQMIILMFTFKQPITELSVFIGKQLLKTFTYNDGPLNYFRMSAWADTLDFTLNTQTLVDGVEEPKTIRGNEIIMARPNGTNSSITGSILEEPEGIFSIWGLVSDIHYVRSDTARNMYLVSYASNSGKDLKEPSVARYPNAWAIYRSKPTAQNPSGAWIFHCNGVKNESTQIATNETLSPGWHLFSVAWSSKSNYIKFLVDTQVAGQSSFSNWPSDFSHVIKLGTWPTQAPEFYFNSKIGHWQFIGKSYDEETIEALILQKPKIT
jgi:Cdc6-like AAA superfamily ATPase